MKKKVINAKYLDHVLPPVSDAFVQETMHTIHTLSLQETAKRPRDRRRLSAVWIAALLIIAMMATALAVAHRIGLIDLFGIGHVDRKEAASVIATDIAQAGGHTDFADFTVEEVFYDGTFLRFLISGAPKDDAVLLWDGFSAYAEGADTRSLEGTRYTVGTETSVEGIEEPVHLYHRRMEKSLLFYTDVFMPEGTSPDAVHVQTTFTVQAIDAAGTAESTTVTFTAGRTAEPSTRSLTVDTDLDFVHIKSVTVATTPLETIVSVKYTPLLRVFAGFSVVPEDGYIKKDGDTYYFGQHGLHFELVDGYATSQYILPRELGEQTSLTLWPKGSRQAITIDLETGASTVHNDITVTADGENTRLDF